MFKNKNLSTVDLAYADHPRQKRPHICRRMSAGATSFNMRDFTEVKDLHVRSHTCTNTVTRRAARPFWVLTAEPSPPPPSRDCTGRLNGGRINPLKGAYLPILLKQCELTLVEFPNSIELGKLGSGQDPNNNEHSTTSKTGEKVDFAKDESRPEVGSSSKRREGSTRISYPMLDAKGKDSHRRVEATSNHPRTKSREGRMYSPSFVLMKTVQTSELLLAFLLDFWLLQASKPSGISVKGPRCALVFVVVLVVFVVARVPEWTSGYLTIPGLFVVRDLLVCGFDLSKGRYNIELISGSEVK
ncbi:hypothetical protein RND71_042373 [Anisodus tanguticus]|uniref:Uncharacterized protein n=1 Tax=Anisodus tanguticus TaxID=243964 RepID=A0AAE1US77_9SOLA|nr:hypothetical protein RND71_042373 [Anisodus tanguticus]